MRTTVDLPDDLYRQAKSEAALRGQRLRDLVEEGLRRVLGLPIQTPPGRRITFPLQHSRRAGEHTLVTFDQGFRRFVNLTCLVLP